MKKGRENCFTNSKEIIGHRRLNFWKFLSFCLIFVILAFLTIFGFNYLRNMYYQKGVNDTSAIIAQQIISNVQKNGFVIVTSPVNDSNPIKVILVPYNGEETVV